MAYQKWNLKEEPFSLTPSPLFFYLSPQHANTRMKLKYLLETNSASIYLSSEVGTGKTSLVRLLAEELVNDKKRKVIYLIGTRGFRNANAFQRRLHEEFKLPTQRAFMDTMGIFEKYLAEMAKDDILPTVIVDEAQSLRRPILEHIHYLLNFVTEKRVLILFLLVGQPELSTRIKTYTSLASRMYPATIPALALDEVRGLLEHRWTVAGGTKLPFTDAAVNTIYDASKGIAREVVKIAGMAMIQAEMDSSKTITEKHVLKAGQELH